MTTPSATPWPERTQTFCLLLIATILGATALSILRDVMIPFVLAVFLTYLISPVVDFLESKAKMPRALALILSLVATLAAVTCVTLILAANIGDLIQGADAYRARLLRLVEGGISVLEGLGFDTNRDAVLKFIRSLPLFQIAGKAAGGLIKGASTGALVLIFLSFLMTGTRSPGARTGIYAEIDQKIRRYIGTKMGISLATGGLTWLTLGVAGTELSFLFAFLTFLLNFIPTVGSIFAVLLPLPVLILQFPSLVTVGILVASLGAIQFVLGNVIEPKLMGQSLDLHPATILLALAFWGAIWGAAGMFLAVPLMAIIKIIVSRIEATRNLGELMAGRLPS